MQGFLPYTVLLLAACATPQVADTSSVGELEFSFTRDVSGARPLLIATITNRSANQICIGAEMLHNPGTGEVNLRFRDARGREVRGVESGGLPPGPLPGMIRLDPGANTQGRYYLDWRLRLRREGAPLPQGLSAQISFPYGHCEDIWSLRATSAWLPF
jgi:hypothetical protein